MIEMMNRSMFTSATDLWSTPQWLFDRLNAMYGPLTTDVCATPDNAKCEQYFTPEMDGLKQEWTGRCWMNPPYGRQIGQWLKKAYESAQGGALVVCLIPSRTDTSWWHDYVMRGNVEFLRGRLKFSDSKSCAPFPSAIVVFGADGNGSVTP